MRRVGLSLAMHVAQESEVLIMRRPAVPGWSAILCGPKTALTLVMSMPPEISFLPCGTCGGVFTFLSQRQMKSAAKAQQAERMAEQQRALKERAAKAQRQRVAAAAAKKAEREKKAETQASDLPRGSLWRVGFLGFWSGVVWCGRSYSVSGLEEMSRRDTSSRGFFQLLDSGT